MKKNLSVAKDVGIITLGVASLGIAIYFGIKTLSDKDNKNWYQEKNTIIARYNNNEITHDQMMSELDAYTTKDWELAGTTLGEFTLGIAGTTALVYGSRSMKHDLEK